MMLNQIQRHGVINLSQGRSRHKVSRNQRVNCKDYYKRIISYKEWLMRRGQMRSNGKINIIIQRRQFQIYSRQKQKQIHLDMNQRNQRDNIEKLLEKMNNIKINQ